MDRRGGPPADVVITMGCGDACPIYPGKRYEDWELDDPAGLGVEGVRPIRDVLGAAAAWCRAGGAGAAVTVLPDPGDPARRARARVHAALAEPVRLAIVEALVLTDLAPDRFGAEAGLGGNLLAHHLKVLEDAGLVRRTVSAGARSVARAHGLTLADQPRGYDDVSEPDLVVSVCDRAREATIPFEATRLHSVIPDPVGGGPGAFRAAFQELDGRIDRLARHIDAA